MRTAEAAADYAQTRVGSNMPDEGLCLQFTRQNYPIDSYYYSAIDAWHAAKYPHAGDRTVPIGFPTFFLSSSIYDHVAICVGTDTFQVTTFNAEIRTYGLADMESIYGPLLGWSEDLNTVRIYSGGSESTTEEDDMRMIRRGQSGSTSLIGDGWYLPLGSDSITAFTHVGIATTILATAEYDTVLACLVQGKTAVAAELRASQ